MFRRIVITLILAVAYAASQNCNQPKLFDCSTKLSNFIKLEADLSTSLFTNYSILYDYSLLKFGLKNGNSDESLNFCNGMENFNLCMLNNKKCLGLQYLSEQSNLQNAYMSQGNLHFFTFHCGPGLNTVIHEGLACYQRVMYNNQELFAQCVNSYATSVTHDKQNGCKYVNDLINCYSVPFKKAPCLPADQSYLWWACEANNKFTKPQFGQCNIDCNSVFRSPLLALHMETHYKYEFGQHWAKIPDHVDKIDGELVQVEGKWFNLKYGN